jgi:hypothetical protein
MGTREGMVGMRLRRQFRMPSGTIPEKNAKDSVANNNEETIRETGSEADGLDGDARQEIKEAKPAGKFRPLRMLERMISNPNFNLQIMLILLTLSSENMRMDRKLQNMSATMEKIGNINEVINNSMQSLKVITEVPKSVRRILE